MVEQGNAMRECRKRQAIRDWSSIMGRGGGYKMGKVRV